MTDRTRRPILASQRARLQRIPPIREMLSALAVAAGHVLIRQGPASGSGFVSKDSPVIIVGMHRSGTSMVARLLERAGMYVGGTWLDENHEAVHFLRANRAMVGEGPYTLHDYGWTAPKTDEFIAARRGFAERAARGIDRFFAERNGETAWGWKDPRNCLTLPIWLSIYPKARVLQVVRHGKAVALSLTDRDGLHPAFGLALWAHYVLRAERALEALPESRKITVRFEDLADAPPETLAKLCEFAGLRPVADLEAIAANVDRERAVGRLDDARVTEIGDHPLLSSYGYA